VQILISNIRLIGDVILTTPLIDLLHRQCPGAAIDLLVNKGTGEFLRKDPRVRQVLTTSNSEFQAGKQSGHYLSAIIRRYDWAITMNASQRGMVAAALAGRQKRIGFRADEGGLERWWRERVMTRLLDLKSERHVVEGCAQVAEALGLNVDRLQVDVRYDDEDRMRVKEVLDQLGCQPPFFVVHPFARWDYKFWSMQGFAEVSDHLASKYGMRPLWTSSPDAKEQQELQRAAGLCRQTPLLVPGLLTLSQMSCLLEQADFYLGLDTAVTHIAASHAPRLPMAAIFGPTLIHRWHPWNNERSAPQITGQRGLQKNGRIVTIQADCDCVPCGLAGCDDQGGPSRCLQQLPVTEVLRGVDLALADYEDKNA